MVIETSGSSIKYVLSERERLVAAKNVLARMRGGGMFSCSAVSVHTSYFF